MEPLGDLVDGPAVQRHWPARAEVGLLRGLGSRPLKKPGVGFCRYGMNLELESDNLGEAKLVFPVI